MNLILQRNVLVKISEESCLNAPLLSPQQPQHVVLLAVSSPGWPENLLVRKILVKSVYISGQ